MNYIIFDLEFNQYYNSKNDNKIKHKLNCPFEIIQIGAIKLDKDLQTVETFDRLIKPELYTEIHPFVEHLTGISAEQLALGKSFKEVYKDFLTFIGDEKSIFSTWGNSDMKELFRNLQCHKLPTASFPKEYIDIQAYASEYLNCPENTSVSLRNAVEMLKLPLKEDFHNALNDAYYTAQIFTKLYNKNLRISKYIPERSRRKKREPHKKAKVDAPSLIKQFEKMYNREMSDEEVSIIKLAYLMGKSGQFLTIDPEDSIKSNNPNT